MERIQSVFFIVWVDETGVEKLDANVYSSRESAQSVCDRGYKHSKEAKAFHVAEFRRVEGESSDSTETVTLTAPEGTIGAIGTPGDGEDPGSESAP
jgi:hypothetical protein